MKALRCRKEANKQRQCPRYGETQSKIFEQTDLFSPNKAWSPMQAQFLKICSLNQCLRKGVLDGYTNRLVLITDLQTRLNTILESLIVKGLQSFTTMLWKKGLTIGLFIREIMFDPTVFGMT